MKTVKYNCDMCGNEMKSNFRRKYKRLIIPDKGGVASKLESVMEQISIEFVSCSDTTDCCESCLIQSLRTFVGEIVENQTN